VPQDERQNSLANAAEAHEDNSARKIDIYRMLCHDYRQCGGKVRSYPGSAATRLIQRSNAG
jgi:hypothetical protein